MRSWSSAYAYATLLLLLLLLLFAACATFETGQSTSHCPAKQAARWLVGLPFVFIYID